MPAHLVRIGAVAAVALSLAACTDNKKDLLAPPAPDKLYVVGGDKPIDVLRPWLPGPEDFVEITAGDYHTCARKFKGDVYCWGQAGGPLNVTSVQNVPTLTFQGAATQISAGASHTCLITSTGAGYCFGAGNQGQLGLVNGQYYTNNAGYVGAPIGQSAPVAFSSIAAGGNSSCGQAASGVYCWGQLGNITNPYTPVSAPYLISSYNGFNSLTVGSMHACGVVSGDSYCWGSNNLYQSGVDPSMAMFYSGTTMLIFAQSNGMGTSVARISAHGDFTCADKVNGTVQCFGSNYNGQLGNGYGGWGSKTWVPQNVGGGAGRQLRGVSTGSEHACALDPSGYAFCWGWGLYGQLGQGASVNMSMFPVAVTGGRTYKAIAAGRNHSCAIGTDNHIYCWGQNNYRQLGTWIVDSMGNEVRYGYSPNPVLTL